MATTRVTPRLIRRIALLAAALGLLAWYATWARARVQARPPLDPDHLLSTLRVDPPTDPDDVTPALAPLLIELAAGIQSRSFNQYAGWRYAPSEPGIDVEIALTGPWQPKDRPALQSVIDGLRDPELRAQLTRLHALRGKPWHADVWGWQYGGAERHFEAVPEVVDLLLADARYFHHLGDADTARDDLETAWWLACTLPPDSLAACRYQAHAEWAWHTEFWYQMQEGIVPDATRDAAAAWLATAPESGALWERAVAGHRRLLQTVLDATYTRDEHGDGWIDFGAEYRAVEVLNTATWSVMPEVAAPVGNLFSFLWNDRATVDRKIDRTCDALADHYRSGHDDLWRFEDIPGTALNALDGHLLAELTTDNSAAPLEQVLQTAGRRATLRIQIALNRYRAAFGHYPITLDRLVPQWLPELPRDPNRAADEPYSYSPATADQFHIDSGLAYPQSARPDAAEDTRQQQTPSYFLSQPGSRLPPVPIEVSP
jgi:hypothetical protein